MTFTNNQVVETRGNEQRDVNAHMLRGGKVKRLRSGPGGEFVGEKRKERSVSEGRRDFCQGGEEGRTVELLRSVTGQETGGECWEAEGAVVGKEVGEEAKEMMMTKKSPIRGEKKRQLVEFNLGTNLGRGGGDLGSRAGGCGEERTKIKDPMNRKALATVTNMVMPVTRSQTSSGRRSWGTRSQTATGRRSPRAEVTGWGVSSLERVMKVKDDASLGLRLAQVEGKGRGVLVSLVCPRLHVSNLGIPSLFEDFLFSTAAAPPQTTRRFMRGEYVVEYKGTLLSYNEASVSLLFIAFHFM